MRPQHLAVVMPAYNESQAIGSFVQETVEALKEHAERITVVIVNDRSTDDTSTVLHALTVDGAAILAIDSPVNEGHGPTAVVAYLAGLATGADVILHVDGDGQFVGPDFPRVLNALAAVDVVHGVRRNRTDPWYRKAVTGAVFLVVGLWTLSRVPDVNTPLRIYRRRAIERLLRAIPLDALVPHVHFSVLERRFGFRVAHVEVQSIPRRGDSTAGTMWGVQKRPPILPPKRLRTFLAKAGAEVFRYRVRHVRPVAPALASEPVA